MSDAFFNRLVRSETLVIKTDDLALSLKKVSSDGVKGLSMAEGPSNFQLPGSLGDLGGDVNVKVRSLLELESCCDLETRSYTYVLS